MNSLFFSVLKNVLATGGSRRPNNLWQPDLRIGGGNRISRGTFGNPHSFGSHGMSSGTFHTPHLTDSHELMSSGTFHSPLIADSHEKSTGTIHNPAFADSHEKSSERSSTRNFDSSQRRDESLGELKEMASTFTGVAKGFMDTARDLVEPPKSRSTMIKENWKGIIAVLLIIVFLICVVVYYCYYNKKNDEEVTQ